MGEQVDVTAWLKKFVGEQRALAGIVYERGAQDDLLILAAAYNLPALAVASARTVHRGQGLAGLAFERNATLSTCTGRPRRRLTLPMLVPQEAAVALPIQDASGEVLALVYLVFPHERRLRDDELIQMLDRAAAAIMRKPPAQVLPAAEQVAAPLRNVPSA